MAFVREIGREYGHDTVYQYQLNPIDILERVKQLI